MGICRRSFAAAGLTAAGVVAIMAATPLAGAATAGEISQYATDAETLLSQEKPGEALDAFEKASDAFWAASPLQLRSVIFADSVEGYGQYRPRGNATFRSGETAKIYAEPFGYGFAPSGSSFTATFTAGISVTTPGGLVLAKAEDFGRLRWEGRTKSHAVQVAIDVELPELRPGDYRLTVTLTDDTTDKSATATLPFAIVE